MSVSSVSSKDAKYDLEKSPAKVVVTSSEITEAHDGVNRSNGAFAKLWKVVQYLDSFGVEVRGIERVPESGRGASQPIDAGLMWMGANCQISTVALGTLGASIFQLQLIDAALTILFFNLLTTIPVALFSTFGKSTGLRQMVLSRYSFGKTIYFPIVLNLIACIGWSTVNTIIGVSALQAVGAGDTQNSLPTAVATLIIALLTGGIALWGYRYVHLYERWSPVPIAIIFVIIIGQAGRYFSTGVGGMGAGEAADVLSFAAAISGFGLGWGSLAADYTVNQPAESSTLKTFVWAYLGLNIPLITLEILGAALMSTFEAKTTWGDAYASNGIGGLLGAPLSAMGGFGDFLLVILALSIVGNNIPNLYSFALTFQAFGKFAQSIPRMFLVILGTAIYIVLAIVGANHFGTILDTLLVILAYWLAIYCVILIEEHFIFRGGKWSNYDLDAYNSPDLLPVGYAAGGAIAVGIVGAVLGMAQLWYIGVIGGMIGPPPPEGFGGDVGFLLSAAFSAITYPPLRYLEKKYVGR